MSKFLRRAPPPVNYTITGIGYDYWATSYGTIGNPTDDYDGDGVNNLSDVGGESFKKRKGFDILPWANKTLVKIKNFWKIPDSLNPKIMSLSTCGYSK